MITNTVLGNLEKLFTAEHNLDFYSGAGVTATYICSTKSHAIQSLVFAAFRILIQRHSILSAIPLDEHKSAPYFGKLSEIDLRTCTSFVERKEAIFLDDMGMVDRELDVLLESQHKLNWKDDQGKKPFWRAIILQSAGLNNQITVSWIFHHALSDGVSGLVFHKHLLRILNQLEQKELLEDGPIVKIPKVELVPPLEGLYKLRLGVSFIIENLWCEWISKRHSKSKLWTGAKCTPDPKFKTLKFRTIVLSKLDTDSLLEMSRNNKTTLSGTLECVTSAAVLVNLDSKKFDRITVAGAISFRRFFRLEGKDIDNEIGVYVSTYRNEHINPISTHSDLIQETKASGQNHVSNIFSWDEARAVRSVINEEIARKGRNSMAGLAHWIGNPNSFWLGKLGKYREEAFCITNIGSWKPETSEDDKWKLSRVVFSQCSSIVGPAFTLSIATGGDGCLVLGFSWLESVVEALLMERIMESIKECIQCLVSGSMKN
ncbi:hypothetical protein COCSADRAFT_99655 [Bipolaris sorokiniana ND90Pr]|uniref:Alcohol acetyltransferase n=1 Tax=Cochliobolus sativus (strain ND90Pr / ATCC 201652) TaxID=665912 RepID=M2ST61_COCSN|nr:uncharacterized protein COCSADRAFT_99655 [Bipolaris sorokiniana ND90Pr]EMD59962.1 hypothetical protein COCSADRAFT_99655 [Bipolaris sorokiniana ND90Pr]